jgi:hypothetical protein
MINRAALLFKYKAPAVAWINEAAPYHGSTAITAEDVNSDRTVYLISDEVADTPDSLERWIKANFKVLFESELEGWYTDPALWPKNRTFALFNKWFEIECHTVLFDTFDGPIFDDDL